MKDDTISRAAAIETVRKAKSIGQAHRMLVQLPSAQRWIPCSVTSPENGGKYYVTQFRYDAYDTDMIGAYVRETDYIWYSTLRKKWFPNGNCKVVAWMPHIEPWEGEQDG